MATIHGHNRKSLTTKTYRSWFSMKQRCLRPGNAKYASYGGSGITVCERWLTFANFLADMGERPEGTTLDRIDGAKGYAPGNCRWATPTEQQNNLRNNLRVRYLGELYTLPLLARHLGVRRDTLKYRIERGWPEERWADEARHGRRLIHGCQETRHALLHAA